MVCNVVPTQFKLKLRLTVNLWQFELINNPGAKMAFPMPCTQHQMDSSRAIVASGVILIRLITVMKCD